ncbi:MAG: ArsR family transcriptional regulator [Candidatus Methanomethylicota archaeon]|uniref:ArsR family transcriptional regulator n=1 Tax=Thermoproteota archaeon TaxID=2056631 RepID=A0A497F253_9CREN|nr:MAG: ArsR family transcriptional regulator [Candidatus Verstraetearchaeota archaeon]RLE53753.1 MAG: ArsR family transcriptional regulator [Candidatus Verstraetearchaeota archaeon]
MSSSSQSQGVLVVQGKDIIRVAVALSSPTRLNILNFLRNREADIGQVAELVKQSKANTSAQIRILERAGLVRTFYRPGVRGVKKVCASNINEIRIILSPPSQQER